MKNMDNMHVIRGIRMKNLVQNLTEEIENLKSDAHFYDMQILFITGLQKTSPEVEQEMDGATFESIIEEDKLMKEKILQQITILNVKLKSLTNEKAS